MKSDYRPLILIGLTIVMWGGWGFFGKLALERNMAPLTIFVAEILVSIICAAPIVIILARKQNMYLLNSSWNIYGLISGTGLAVGLLLYYLALSKAQVSIVAPLTATYPVVSVVLSYVVLGERLSILQWSGVVLVVVGTMLLLSGPIERMS